MNRSALRRVRRGVTTRATSEGDAACQGEITLPGLEGDQPGGPSGLLDEGERSERRPLGGPGGSLDQGMRSAEAPEGPSGSSGDPWIPSAPLRQERVNPDRV